MFNKKITFLDYIPDRRYEIIGNCFIYDLRKILNGNYSSNIYNPQAWIDFYIHDKKYHWADNQENDFIEFINSIDYDYIISVKHVQDGLYTGVVIKFINND